MFRFAVERTDTGFPRLLMLESVFPMYRRLRKITRSACVVVAMEKEGVKLNVLPTVMRWELSVLLNVFLRDFITAS